MTAETLEAPTMRKLGYSGLLRDDPGRSAVTLIYMALTEAVDELREREFDEDYYLEPAVVIARREALEALAERVCGADRVLVS